MPARAKKQKNKGRRYVNRNVGMAKSHLSRKKYKKRGGRPKTKHIAPGAGSVLVIHPGPNRQLMPDRIMTKFDLEYETTLPLGYGNPSYFDIFLNNLNFPLSTTPYTLAFSIDTAPFVRNTGYANVTGVQPQYYRNFMQNTGNIGFYDSYIVNACKLKVTPDQQTYTDDINIAMYPWNYVESTPSTSMMSIVNKRYARQLSVFEAKGKTALSGYWSVRQLLGLNKNQWDVIAKVPTTVASTGQVGPYMGTYGTVPNNLFLIRTLIQTKGGAVTTGITSYKINVSYYVELFRSNYMSETTV
jgi:hypothetical protein